MDSAPKHKRFQPPQTLTLAKHVAYCIVAGPVIYYTIWGATKMEVSITRFRALTNAITTIFGTLLGITLGTIGGRHFQASTWATVVEAQGGKDGVTVDELEDFATGGLVMAPWNLLRRRATKDRRKSRYPWTLNILIYLSLIGLSKAVGYLLERTFQINAYMAQQPNGKFQNISVLGDLSSQDLAWTQLFASASASQNLYQMNYIASLFAGTTRTNSLQRLYNNNTVFFSEVLPGQLLPNAQGPGTFSQTEANLTSTTLDDTTNGLQAVADTAPGQLVRWPRWGIRVTCQSLPDPALYLVPLAPSGSTYVFLPNSLINSLATSLQVVVPPSNNIPWNSSQSLKVGDSLPAGLDPSTIYNAFVKQNDGSSHSGTFFWLDDGTNGHGWKVADIHLARIDTTYTPNGSFAATASVNGSQIGYDVAVCLEVVEPWILQAYNISGGAPHTTHFFGSGNTIGAVNETPHPGVANVLNSSATSAAYQAAAYFSRRDMLGESTGFVYAPSPILVDFTGNAGTGGPGAYTKLSPSHIESVVGGWDSSQALPYLVGTGYIAAQACNDRMIATGSVDKLLLGLVLGLLLLLGVIADICIPALPQGMPLRDFSVLSSISIARSALLKLDAKDQSPNWEAKKPEEGSPLSPVGPEFNMHLDELKGHIGSVPM